MLSFVSRFARLGLLGVLIIAGCASHGSEFLGKWDNAKNAKDTMEIVRNGEQFLIVDQTQKVGAVYKDGALEVQGLFGGVSLTYIKKTDTIVGSGLFGQVEYKRQK
jgi:hypothetical protein